MVKIEKENIKKEVRKMCSIAFSVRKSKGGLVALSKVIHFETCILELN